MWDHGRSRAVLCGAAAWLGTPTPLEIWESSGTTWSLVPASTRPLNRAGFALGYDGQRVLFFGGLDASTFSVLNDTWAWNGSAWQALQPLSVPPGRNGHAMAYDSVRRRLVLFGGFGATVLLNDTWEWDGATWLSRPTAVAPPARSSHAMAFNAATGRVLLFGGFGSNGALSDTWEWDGTTWISRAQTGPSARSDQGMAFDATRARVVLFGGFVQPLAQRYPTMFADTWEWDGSSWTQRFPPQSPSARIAPALYFDATRNRVQLAGGNATTAAADGGYDNVVFADAWEFGP